MDFSDQWRSLWPISSVFSAPNLRSGPQARPLGPLLFHPSGPALPLLSSPALAFKISPPLPPSNLFDNLRAFFRSPSNAAFLPSAALRPLIADLLPSDSSSDPLPSNYLAALRSRRDPSTFLLFFPSGDNAHLISYLSTSLQAPAPLQVFEQREGFKHPSHRISKLTVASAPASDWGEASGDDSSVVVEGFLIATTMYSVNWFRVETRVLESGEQRECRPFLVPLAKQGFESCVADACWSPHFSEESAVLLESGELCWFNLDTMQGGVVKVRLDGGNPGGWFSCGYGRQPWILTVVCSTAVLLIDLRAKRSAEPKVLARFEMANMCSVLECDRFTAFCRAGYSDYHFSVVTEKQLLLFDSRQPVVPVLMWDHGLDRPSFVAMYRLSELRPSEEFKWASESGFAILVGSFWNDEFNLFCYGPGEGGANGKSSLYAWELPSGLSLSGRQCASGDIAVKEELSKDNLVIGSKWQQNDLVVGFYIVPDDLIRLDLEVSDIRGFALIRFMLSGKLEVQRYNASWDSYGEKSNGSGKDLKQATDFPMCCAAQEVEICLYDFFKFRNLCGYMNGNLPDALDMRAQQFNHEGTDGCYFHDAVRELITDKVKSSSLTTSAFISNATVPTSIFEIVSRRVLTGQGSYTLNLAFSKYSEIFGGSLDQYFELLHVPSCLPHHSLPPFFVVKPSRSEKWSKKTSPGEALVGPVLPLPILLTLQQMNKRKESVIALKEEHDDDLLSLECKTILEDMFPEISIADTGNASAWSRCQEIQDEKPFFVYEPVFLDSILTQNNTCSGSKHHIKEGLQEINKNMHHSMDREAAYKDEKFTTFICGIDDKMCCPDSKGKMVGDKSSDLFDVSPVRLDFDLSVPFHPDEEETYKNLKRRFSVWQENYRPYQDFCCSCKIPKVIMHGTMLVELQRD